MLSHQYALSGAPAVNCGVVGGAAETLTSSHISEGQLAAFAARLEWLVPFLTVGDGLLAG